jgi:aspartyl protease family protein
MFRTVGSINGLTVRFLVDTGATTLAINAAEARRLGIDYRFVGRKGVVQTAAGNVPAYHLNLDLVRVGDIIQRQVPAVVIEGDSPDHVLLGMSFLGRLEMENTGQALHLREKFR